MHSYLARRTSQLPRLPTRPSIKNALAHFLDFRTSLEIWYMDRITKLSNKISEFLLKSNSENSIFLGPYLFIKFLPDLKLVHHVGYIALGRRVIVPHCWMTFGDKTVDPTIPFFESITGYTPEYLYDPLNPVDQKIYIASSAELDYDTYETTLHHWVALLEPKLKFLASEKFKGLNQDFMQQSTRAALEFCASKTQVAK